MEGLQVDDELTQEDQEWLESLQCVEDAHLYVEGKNLSPTEAFLAAGEKFNVFSCRILLPKIEPQLCTNVLETAVVTGNYVALDLLVSYGELSKEILVKRIGEYLGAGNI